MAEMTNCPKCNAPVDATSDEYGKQYSYEYPLAAVESVLLEPGIPVQVQKLPNFVGIPSYATEQSSGADLLAAIVDTVHLKPQEVRLIPTGIAISLPWGFEAQIRPRSSKPKKKGLTVANSPGTVDADFTGEVMVMLYNMTNDIVPVEPEEAIAQMVIAPTYQAEWQVVDELDKTERGSGGFGSTDK